MAAIRNNAWWQAPSLAVAVAVGIIGGILVITLIYVVVNDIGVWIDVNGIDAGKRRRRVVVCSLAIVLLPAGILGFFGSGDDGPMGARRAAADRRAGGEVARASMSSIINSGGR